MAEPTGLEPAASERPDALAHGSLQVRMWRSLLAPLPNASTIKISSSLRDVRHLPTMLRLAAVARENSRRCAKVIAVVVGNTVPKTTALEAQAATNGFLLDHLPHCFTAGHPTFDQAAQVWRVPVQPS